MLIDSLVVFCGSKNGNNPLFAQKAEEVGSLLAAHNIRLIFGGGSVGLMGIVADAVLKGGGQVTGIIPQQLVDWEREHKGLTELIVVDNMHSRKKQMYDLAQAALVLPGGFGSLDELFEIITWNQLSIHDKQIFILNTAGFYDNLVKHIDVMKAEGFLYQEAMDRITIIKEPEELISYYKSVSR